MVFWDACLIDSFVGHKSSFADVLKQITAMLCNLSATNLSIITKMKLESILHIWDWC